MAFDRMLSSYAVWICFDPSIHLVGLSKLHKDRPWGMEVNGQRHEVGYWPGESKSGMFGGNSNWRGPICEQLPPITPET
jgi:hypothetical protein